MTSSSQEAILWVNLSTGHIEVRELAESVRQQFLGGMGLGAQMLYEHIPAHADPLGPDNVLGLVPGLLTGSGLPFSGRWMAVGQSPLTGGWGDANSGGYFGPELRRAGFAGVFVTGIAPEPVYLWVHDGAAELRPAGHLWGQDTVDTQERIRQEVGDNKARVACIGPAGERVSRIAAIINDEGRAAARSGLGAVMGSKRLKAVAVRGTGKVTLHDPERVKQLRQDLTSIFKEPAGWMDRFTVSHTGLIGRVMRRVAGRLPISMPTPQSLVRELNRMYGTCGATDYAAEVGDSPVRNWTGVGYRDFPYGTHSSQLSGDRVIALQRRRYHCASCPLGCGGIIDVPDGPYAGEGTKPEYETLAAFGSLCLNNDLGAIVTLNELCNRAGLDTISLGGVLAFAIECYEAGILTPADTGGLDLRWGHAQAMIDLAQRIVQREGLGDTLADGVWLAAERIGGGAEAFAVHAGGQELPMH
ncbi:MAG: aldehyde ferredoxin oxidoreductase, partial [Chloroflexi bacterium]|nr:aldehyde ferredoxin oxidoreductase [Chloroflexota bacterium]